MLTIIYKKGITAFVQSHSETNPKRPCRSASYPARRRKRLYDRAPHGKRKSLLRRTLLPSGKDKERNTRGGQSRTDVSYRAERIIIRIRRLFPVGQHMAHKAHNHHGATYPERRPPAYLTSAMHPPRPGIFISKIPISKRVQRE